MKNSMKKIVLTVAAILMMVPAFCGEGKGKGKIISINKPKTNNPAVMDFFNILVSDLTKYTDLTILIGQPGKAEAKITGSIKPPVQGSGYKLNFSVVKCSNNAIMASYSDSNVRPIALKNGLAAHETAYNLLNNLGFKFNQSELAELYSMGVKVKGFTQKKGKSVPEPTPLAPKVEEDFETFVVDFTI